MTKALLIVISITTATLTVNAHCGTCGTGEKVHYQDKAAKSCCSESGSCCYEKEACSDDKKSCDTKEKSCCGACGDKSSPSEKDGDDKKSCGVSKEATSAAKSTIPMPKMSCCPSDA